jgi:parallel beta-helix repeat protein
MRLQFCRNAMFYCAVLLAAFFPACSSGGSSSSPPPPSTTLCVNPGGTGGCYSTIQAAVSAAAANDTINVAAGTYTEDVTIGKSLSLVGAGAGQSIIDATNLANGILLDGLNNPGLQNVTISGFTVQNAMFEGVLLLNTTGVQVLNNNIVNNDQVVVSTSGATACSNQPDYETDESYDCGGGLHLLGAVNSNVSGNMVSGNADGIIITDETQASTGNTVTNNIVNANPLVCGIVLASHPPVGSQPPNYAQHNGVNNNTISNNTSTNNGAKQGGAGVGLFADGNGPGVVMNNTVTGNTLTGNSLPGVAIHSHKGPANGHPADNMSGNSITNNTISGNGADVADSETPGTAGINISSGDGGSPITGITVTGNTINGQQVDVGVNTAVEVDISQNNLLGTGIGVANDCTLDGASCTGSNINAAQNYWGCSTGPGTSGCTTVSGADITSTPFLTSTANATARSNSRIRKH